MFFFKSALIFVFTISLNFNVWASIEQQRLQQSLEKDIAAFTVTLSRDIKLYRWSTKKGLLTNHNAQNVIDSFFIYTRSEHGQHMGNGLYFASNPMQSAHLFAQDWALYEVVIPAGSKIWDIRKLAPIDYAKVSMFPISAETFQILESYLLKLKVNMKNLYPQGKKITSVINNQNYIFVTKHEIIHYLPGIFKAALLGQNINLIAYNYFNSTSTLCSESSPHNTSGAAFISLGGYQVLNRFQSSMAPTFLQFKAASYIKAFAKSTRLVYQNRFFSWKSMDLGHEDLALWSQTSIFGCGDYAEDRLNINQNL